MNPRDGGRTSKADGGELSHADTLANVEHTMRGRNKRELGLSVERIKDADQFLS